MVADSSVTVLHLVFPLQAQSGDQNRKQEACHVSARVETVAIAGCGAQQADGAAAPWDLFDPACATPPQDRAPGSSGQGVGPFGPTPGRFCAQALGEAGAMVPRGRADSVRHGGRVRRAWGHEKGRSGLGEVVLLEQAPEGAPLLLRCPGCLGHIALVQPQQLGQVGPFKICNDLAFRLLEGGTVSAWR